MKKHLLLLLLVLPLGLHALPAPDFTITTSDGVQRQLYPDYVNQGKVVVVEMFFTTCPPCNAHAPFFQTLYQSMQAAHPGKVEFLLLSVLGTDTNVKVQQYRTSKNMTMPGAGSDGGSQTALQPYQSGQFGQYLGTPTFFIISPDDGEVIFDVRGTSAQNTMDLIAQHIEQLLAPEGCAVESFFGNPVDSVELRVSAAGFDTVMLATGGSYLLAGIPALQNATYDIVPYKDDEPLAGLSTYDLVLIARHILGIEPFQHPWQLTAADMNCSGTITTYDIVIGRRVILGIADTFLCGGTWRFDPDTAVASNGNCAPFKAVKLGDVNGNYLWNADDRSGAPLPLQCIQPAAVQPGAAYRTVIQSTRSAGLGALQFTLGFDPGDVEILSVRSDLPGFDEQAYSLDRSAGRLSVAWFDARSAWVEAAGALLVVEWRARRAGAALVPVAGRTAARAWDAAGTAHALRWTSPAASGGIDLSPNPARAQTVLTLTRAGAGPVRLQWFDGLGRLVSEQTLLLEAGEQQIALSRPAGCAGACVLRVDGEAVRCFWVE